VKLNAFHNDLQALVIRHGAVLTGPVQVEFDRPIQHVVEEGPVTYAHVTQPVTLNFTIKANYTEDFKAFFGKNRGPKT
jgi:hypothetical protein